MPAEIDPCRSCGGERIDCGIRDSARRAVTELCAWPKATIESRDLANVAGLYLSLRKIADGPGT